MIGLSAGAGKVGLCVMAAVRPGDRVRMSREYLDRLAAGSGRDVETRGTVVTVHTRHLCVVRFDGESYPCSISTRLLEVVERHG